MAADSLWETTKEYNINMFKELYALGIGGGIKGWTGGCGRRYVCIGLLKSDNKKCLVPYNKY